MALKRVLIRHKKTGLFLNTFVPETWGTKGRAFRGGAALAYHLSYAQRRQAHDRLVAEGKSHEDAYWALREFKPTVPEDWEFISVTFDATWRADRSEPTSLDALGVKLR